MIISDINIAWMGVGIAIGGIISIIVITINKLARAYIEKADNDNDDSN